MGTVIWKFLAFSFKGDFQFAMRYMLRGHIILILGFTFHRPSVHSAWIILVLHLPFTLGLRKQCSKQQKQNPGCFSVWEFGKVSL